MALENNVNANPAVILAGQTTTPEIGLAPFCLCGILSDANWTAEGISLLQSLDDVVFTPVVTAAGANPLGNLTASTFMTLDPGLFRGVRAIKVVSSVAQTNTTTLTIVSVPVI
jgi:hypothetical protein